MCLKKKSRTSPKFPVSYEKDTTKDPEGHTIDKTTTNQNHTEPNLLLKMKTCIDICMYTDVQKTLDLCFKKLLPYTSEIEKPCSSCLFSAH